MADLTTSKIHDGRQLSELLDRTPGDTGPNGRTVTEVKQASGDCDEQVK